MRKVSEFTEEKFINNFIMDIKTKAACFCDIDSSTEYITNDIIPMINIIDFMLTHHFISEDGYFQCKEIYNEVTSRCANILEERQYLKNAQEQNAIMEEDRIKKEYEKKFLENHKVGDKVIVRSELKGYNLPKFLSKEYLIIKSFTSFGNVMCQNSRYKVYSIPPYYLKDAE